MKRKGCKSKEDPSLKKANISELPDFLRSKINEKVQTVLDGLSQEIDIYSNESGLEHELNTSTNRVTTRSQKLNQETILASFVDKAKFKLSELLLKESNNLKKVQNCNDNSSGDGTKSSIQVSTTNCLQTQITQKLQSLLYRALDEKISSNNVCKKTDFDIFSEEEWKDFSDMLQHFMNSAKKKFCVTLSDRSETKNSPDHHHNSNSKSSSKENNLNSLTKELRAFRRTSHKTSNSSHLYQHIPLSSSSARQNMMTSPIHGESDSFDRPYSGASNARRRMPYNGGGVLLLEDAERAPEYLNLTIDSDVDEPVQEPMNMSDSEEDVIVLGEKRPTYQEITLEEDEEGEVKESVIEKEKDKPPDNEEEEQLFPCPSCDKSFRLENLLDFHVKIHNAIASTTNTKTSDSSSLSSSKNESNQKLVKHKKKRYSREKGEKRHLKKNSKKSRKHKNHHEKHKSHKRKKHKRSEIS